MSSTFLGLFVSGLAISGLIVTAYILFVVTLTKQVNTVNGILLVQLAVVEFLLSFLFLICSMPRIIVRLSSGSETDIGIIGTDGANDTDASCTICGALFTLLRPISVWTVCGLNCDRYYAISSPLHYGSLINPRKTITAICVLWTLSFVLCVLPFLYPAPYIQHFLLFSCIPHFTYDVVSACYTVVLFFVIFLLPLILILTCNVKIFLIARYHKHRIASAIFEVTLSAQVTITHQRNPFRPLLWANKFKGRSAFFTVLQLVGAFLLIYVPYYCILFWESLSNYYQQYATINSSTAASVDGSSSGGRSLATSLSSVLIVCSSTVNGLLYGVKSKPLRKSFQNYWRKKTTKNELNQEIQARTPSTCGSRRPSLTPFGFFSRQATLRRPSEASIDTQRTNLLGLQQCLNEIAATTTFRPASSPGLGTLSSSSHNDSFTELRRTRSFRTNGSSSSSVINEKFRQFVSFSSSDDTVNERIRLAAAAGRCLGNNGVSSSNEEDSPIHHVGAVNNSLAGFNNNNNNNNKNKDDDLNNNKKKKFIGRLKKFESAVNTGGGIAAASGGSGVVGYNNKLKSRHRRKEALHSPRILITRAFSEENESSTTIDRHHNSSSPTPKQSSSVTTLIAAADVNCCWRGVTDYPHHQEDRIFSFSQNPMMTLRILRGEGDEQLSGESNDSSSENDEASRNTTASSGLEFSPKDKEILQRNHQYRDNDDGNDNDVEDDNNNNSVIIDGKKQTIIDAGNTTAVANSIGGSWPCGKKKSIKFHIGSVLLSDGQFQSQNEDTFV